MGLDNFRIGANTSGLLLAPLHIKLLKSEDKVSLFSRTILLQKRRVLQKRCFSGKSGYCVQAGNSTIIANISERKNTCKKFILLLPCFSNRINVHETSHFSSEMSM